MKNLLFTCLMSLTVFANFAKADAMMTSNMLLTTTVLMSAATDDNPKDNADFYINQHRVVQNTSVDVRHIENTLLKAKTIKENFEKENLRVMYSFNNAPYVFLEPYSLKNFKEPIAYVTLKKIEYKNKKAIVFITMLDKSAHDKLVETHNSNVNLVLWIGGVFLLFLVMLMFSLSL